MSVKTLKTRTVHFVYSLRIFVSAHVNYGSWHVYIPSFGTSVAICRLACSEISLSIKEKKTREKFRRESDMVDGVTALAQLYALLSYKARSFNQCLRVLYPNFIITYSSQSNFAETVLVVGSN